MLVHLDDDGIKRFLDKVAPNRRRHMVTLRLNDDEMGRLSALCREYGRTRSDVLRHLLVNAGALSAGATHE